MGSGAGGVVSSVHDLTPARRQSPAFRLGRRLRQSGDIRRWSVLRAALIIALVLGAGFGAVLLRGWILAAQVPAWWLEAGAAVEAGADARAEAVERGVSAALYSPRGGDGPWTVELQTSDANAWLRERLPRWLANRGLEYPSHISTPRVFLTENAVTLGVALSPGGPSKDRIIVLSFRPAVEEDGSIRARDVRVFVGRAEMPGAAEAWMAWLPQEWTQGEAARWLRSAIRGESALAESSIRLEDGRTVRVLALSVQEGRIRVTCVDGHTPSRAGGSPSRRKSSR